MGKQMSEQGSRGTKMKWKDIQALSHLAWSDATTSYPLPWSAWPSVETATNNLSGGHGGQALASVSAKAEAALVICTSYGPIMVKKGDV